MEILTDTLTQLAKARQVLAAAEEAVAQAQADLAESPLHKRVLLAQAHRDQMRQLVNDTDAEARALARQSFEATGEKKPAAGVEVKLFRRLRYDAAEAFAWCKSNAPTFLRESIDTKSFERVAHELPGAPVTVEYEPRPQIAKDLSEYLAQEEVPELFNGCMIAFDRDKDACATCAELPICQADAELAEAGEQ